MLFMIGAVPIEVWPFNAHEGSSSNEATFAEKAVLGRRPILEAVGDGASTLKFSGRLFPKKLGGLAELDQMQAQRAAQYAVPVMRGDGTPLGWFVITQVDVKSSHFAADGIGKVLEVEISLKQSDPPGPVGIGAILSSLFN
jgi:uncharacterized protein